MPDLISILGATSKEAAVEGPMRLSDVATPLVGKDFSNVFLALTVEHTQIKNAGILPPADSVDDEDTVASISDWEGESVGESEFQEPAAETEVIDDGSGAIAPVTDREEELDTAPVAVEFSPSGAPALTEPGSDLETAVAPTILQASEALASDAGQVDAAKGNSVAGAPDVAPAAASLKAQLKAEVNIEKPTTTPQFIHPVEAAVRRALDGPTVGQDTSMIRRASGQFDAGAIGRIADALPGQVTTRAIPVPGGLTTPDPVLKPTMPAPVSSDSMAQFPNGQSETSSGTSNVNTIPEPRPRPQPQPQTAAAPAVHVTTALAVESSQASTQVVASVGASPASQSGVRIQTAGASNQATTTSQTAPTLGAAVSQEPASPHLTEAAKGPMPVSTPAVSATGQVAGTDPSAAEIVRMRPPNSVDTAKQSPKAGESTVTYSANAVEPSAPQPTTTSAQPSAQVAAANVGTVEVASVGAGSEVRAEPTFAQSTESTTSAARTSEPTATQPFTSSRAPEVAREIARQIAPSIVASADGSVDIALSPKELGHIKMSLSLSESGVTLIINGERPETIELMRRHANELSATFREMGYDDVAFSFSTGGDASASQDQGQDDGTGAPSSSGTGDTPNANTQTAQNGAVPQTTVSDGGLDLRM